MNNGYLDIGDAARFLGVKPYTVREWCNGGRISHFRVGKSFRFRVEDLNNFMAKGFKPSITPGLDIEAKQNDGKEVFGA